MSVIDLVVAGERVVTPQGVRPAAVLIEKGKIAAVVNRDEIPAGVPGYDAGAMAVLPGLVDSHVHVNEPGRTDWEGFETATQAAAAGGITAIVDMPLNCIPVTTTLEALDFKLDAAAGRCWVDAAFWGGVVPGNAGHLRRMAERGARGFKAFLIHSGIEDFPASREEDLRRALPILSELKLPLLVHAEVAGQAPAAAGRDYADYLASRPASWEREAISLMIRLCREFGSPVHIVHLSDAGSLPLIAEAKQEGLPLTVETCPHYLTFRAEEIEEGRTDFKCAPPIREEANREALWLGLKDGVIDMVVSDHSPCLPGLKLLKEGDFAGAWGGISSLQFAFPALWAQARLRGFGLEEVVRWMSQRPARLAGIAKNKGALAAGLDADLVVWDTETEYKLEPHMIRHRHKISPYIGRALRGLVAAAFLRGGKVYENGAFLDKPRGELFRDE